MCIHGNMGYKAKFHKAEILILLHKPNLFLNIFLNSPNDQLLDR